MTALVARSELRSADPLEFRARPLVAIIGVSRVLYFAEHDVCTRREVTPARLVAQVLA
jgi:hypothetical protein